MRRRAVQQYSGRHALRLRLNELGYTIADDDFNVLSYRSNVVLRWEWRPGSTLFVIWQQNRSSYCTDAFESAECHRPPNSIGSAPGVGSVVDARTAPGDNFFAIKATYWLSLH